MGWVELTNAPPKHECPTPLLAVGSTAQRGRLWRCDERGGCNRLWEVVECQVRIGCYWRRAPWGLRWRYRNERSRCECVDPLPTLVVDSRSVCVKCLKWVPDA